MQELRRVRSGVMSENKDMYTLHDIVSSPSHKKRESLSWPAVGLLL